MFSNSFQNGCRGPNAGNESAEPAAAAVEAAAGVVRPAEQESSSRGNQRTRQRRHRRHRDCRDRPTDDESSTSDSEPPPKPQHAPRLIAYKSRTKMSEPTNARLSYATGLLHVALAGASGWALHECNARRSPLAFGCFGFLLGHSLLGVLRFTHPHVKSFIITIYQHTQLLAQIGPIALITAQVSRHLDQPVQHAYLYAFVTLVPTVCELLLPERNERALDVVVLGVSCSLGYLGLSADRYWTTGLAVLTVLNHFSYRPIADQFDVPRSDLITLGLSFFTMFAVNAVLETA